METLANLLIWLVIIGHAVFAGMQAFKWPFVAKRLLDIEDEETIARTETVGKSFASYNLSISIGLALSFQLDPTVMQNVQLTVLALIVFTAVVGMLGTRSKVILLGRLLPAAAAFVFVLLAN